MESTESNDKVQWDIRRRQIMITSSLEEEMLKQPTVRGHSHKTEEFRAYPSGFHYRHFLLWLEIPKVTLWDGEGKYELKEDQTSHGGHLSGS